MMTRNRAALVAELGELAVAHCERFRKVSTGYPREVADAYQGDIARAAGDSGELARRVHRRRTAVLAALRSDPCFEHGGRTRVSRSRLAAQQGQGWNGTGTGRNELPWPELDASGVPALVRRAEATPEA